MFVSGGTFTQYGVNTGANTVASLEVDAGAICTWDSPATGGTLTISGDVSNAGTLLFNDKQVTIGGKVTGNITFMDLIIPDTKTVTPQGGATLTVLRNLTIDDGGKYVHNGQTLTLGGTAIAAIVTGEITDNNTGSNSLQNLGAVKLVAGGTSTTPSATTKTLESAIVAISVDVGPNVTLLTSDKNLSLTGSLTGSGAVTASGTETITVGGSMSVASFNAGSSTFTFDGGSAATCLGYTFYNLVMDMDAVGTTLTPSAGITVTNGFTQARGTFVADGPASGLLHKIAGKWDSYSSGSGADVGFIPGNSTIELTSTTPPVNSALSFYNLTLDAGGALSRSATVTNSFVAGASAGTLTLGSYTLTVGGALTLDSNCTLVATGSTVVLNGSAGQTVTTNAQDFNNLTIDTRPSGTVTFSGALNVNGTWTVGGSGAYNVTVLNGGTAANAVTFNNTGVLTINTASTESFTFTGGVTATSPSGIQTAGTIATTNTAMTLGGTLQTLTLDVGTTLTSGSGIIHVEGPVTDGSGSYTLTLGNASQTGAITIDGALTVNGLATANSAYALNLNQLAGGQTSVIDTAVIFNNTGALVIGNDAADSFTFTVGAAKEAGPASFAGTIASTNNVQNWTTTGAITITADTTFTTGTASLAFGGLIDADTSGSHALVLTSAGAITLGKAIGSTKSLFSLASTAAGTIAINGSSITTASAQSYVGPVTLGVDTVLAAGGSGTAISFGSTIDGGNSLALDSGSTGAITVTGNVGGITPLATVTITNSNGATFDGSIVANSFIIANTASSATVLAKGAMTLATGMTVTGTSNAYNVSLTGGAVIAGATTFANTGTLILGDEATDTFTFTEGLVATAPTLDSFQGTVSTDLAAGHDISLKNLAVGSGDLTLNASGALDNVLLSGSVTVQDGDLTVYAVSLNTASVAAADRGTLTVSPADSPTGNRTATFNVTGLYLSGLTTTISGSYLGVADLTSAAFTVGTLSNAGTLRLTGTQATHACSSYSVAEGTVEYYDGSSAGTVFTSGMSDGTQNYYNLLIVGPTQTFTLENDIVLKNNLSITGGYLDVGSSNHAISLGGDWSNPLETAAWNATTEVWDFGTPRFVARAGTVTFTKSSGVITVSGSNQWCGFICTKAGVTIRFENGKVQRIIAGGIFQVQGTSSSYINLNRVTAGTTPSTPPVTLTDDSEFWFFDLIPGATLDMQYTYVWYSNARSYPVSVPSTVLATPYATYYSYKWLNYLFTMYSYTEDSDYNGKIDRIRVTTEAAVGDDFTGFTAVVDGYDVTGYSRPAEGNTFYILLKEKGYTDTGATPNWHITVNTTLKDKATETKFVSTLSRHGGSDWMTPGNTAWPVVGYTLMVPGKGQAFVQFSEPIVTSASATPTATDFDTGGSSLVAVTKSGNGIREATWTTNARDVAAIAGGASTFSLTSTLRGMGSAPYWELAYETLVIGAPNPTYPPVTGYVTGSEGIPTVYTYAADRSDDAMRAINPFNLYRGGAGKTTHRVSDLLISAPPSSTAASDYPHYFVWPVWAKDSRTVSLSEDEIEALTSSTAASSGIGLIRSFDGTQWLRDQDMTIQAREDAALSGAALTLHYDTSPASTYVSAYGLWLPAHNESAFSGLVPYPDTSTVSISENSSSSGALRNATIDSTNSKIVSGKSFEFFYTIAGSPSSGAPLYCARLDMTAGGTVPDNWYRLVKPFAFEIHDVRSQKGSVTILNNVIDPTKGETVRLSYQVPSAGTVTVTVFTLDGDVVKRLYSGTCEAGDYSTSWDGRNLNGASVARGIYFVRVVGPDLDELRKVLVVRK
jgi:fibronectin-binding autotransporter adhesin